jgi:signal recognition particle subunit SRP54
MFKNLSDRLNDVFKRLGGRGLLNEADVSTALREVRIALLEADVALPVVKELIEKVKEKAVGQEVLKSVKPAQQVIKIVNDHLIDVLGRDYEPLNLATTPPVVIMMVGLQGSGKTTTTAKLGRRIQNKDRKKVLMASLDIYRPAAREQLRTLGQENDIATLDIVEGEKPLAITKRAIEQAKRDGMDVVILDTAGRLHINDELMNELEVVRDYAKPIETLLIADAMTGQDAVKVAEAFQNRIGVTGIVLTRIDGDARGGAALSMRFITGCPIKFLGVGEQSDRLEEFHPDRIASRILDMGDIVTLVEKATENLDQEEAQKLAKKMEKGTFDLDDMATQLLQMEKLGGISGMMNMLPGMGKIQDKIDKAGMDDKVIKRQVAIIRSMTQKERKNTNVLNASRRRRIAQGSGTTVQDVNRLIKQFKDMSKIMGRMRKLGKKGMLRQGISGLFSKG